MPLILGSPEYTLNNGTIVRPPLEQVLAALNAAGILTTADIDISGGIPSYAFGSFTPTAEFVTPGSSTWTYATQEGSYVKIGKNVQVWINLDMTPTIGTGTGALQLPLPFTPAVAGAGVAGRLNANWIWPPGPPVVTYVTCVAGLSGFLNINGQRDGAGQVSFGAANMTSGASHTVRLYVSYQV